MCSVVPSGPASKAATVAASCPRIDMPSTLSTTSPGRTPAMAAGPSEIAALHQDGAAVLRQNDARPAVPMRPARSSAASSGGT